MCRTYPIEQLVCDDLWWPDLTLTLTLVCISWPWFLYTLVYKKNQVLQFVFLTCWRVLAECDQSALRCLGSWPNNVEACNFDLWPDLDLLKAKLVLFRFVLLRNFVCLFPVSLRPFVRKLDWGGGVFRPPPPPMEGGPMPQPMPG